MAMGMYKDVQKASIQQMFADMYERYYIDGYLQPFYRNFFEEHKELIIVCHNIVKFRAEEPEYHIGALEVAYGHLLEMHELQEHLTRLEDIEEVSIPYRRSTK